MYKEDLKKIRKSIVETSYLSKEGHIPSSLSILDILYVLYKEVLNTPLIKTKAENRDRFILSKGHAALGMFAILDHFDILEQPLSEFCTFNGHLGGHPSDRVRGIEASTGSLGHGLPMGVGIALGHKILKYDKRVFVLIGDGEANEGSIWEAALIAANHKLDNLTCIMDYNRSGDRALNIHHPARKFEAFGWVSIEIDGHDHKEILTALNTTANSPIFILANTIKGYGIKMMENNPEWHHKVPTSEEMAAMLSGE